MGKITFEYPGGKLEFEKDDKFILEMLEAYKDRLLPAVTQLPRHSISADDLEASIIERMEEQKNCMIGDCPNRGSLGCGKECNKYFPRKSPEQPETDPPTNSTFETIHRIDQALKNPTKAEQLEKAKPEKKKTGRPSKYPDEVKQRVLELLRKGKKPGEVHTSILKEFDIDIPMKTLYCMQRTSKRKSPGSNPSPTKEPEDKAEGKYDFMIVPARRNDLKIIDGKVTCPKTGVDVEVEKCRSGCVPYITIIRHIGTKEPHVRCARAKLEG